jgi:hypothetical protein
MSDLTISSTPEESSAAAPSSLSEVASLAPAGPSGQFQSGDRSPPSGRKDFAISAAQMALENLVAGDLGSSGEVFITAWGDATTSNKPLEWTGRQKLSSAPPFAPCLPLRGSVRRIGGKF